MLDKLIETTRKKKKSLLAVLTNPTLPLHNNASELAVKKVVRKRDISLHTMTADGTTIRDCFLSIIDTARKLGINAFAYVKQIVSKDKNRVPIEVAIRSFYGLDKMYV